MESRYTWKDAKLYAGGWCVGRVRRDKTGSFHGMLFGLYIYYNGSDFDYCKSVVESAFEAWLEKAGLVWKDSPTEEKEA